MSFEGQRMDAFVSSSSAGGTVGIIVLAAGGSTRMGVPKHFFSIAGEVYCAAQWRRQLLPSAAPLS